MARRRGGARAGGDWRLVQEVPGERLERITAALSPDWKRKQNGVWEQRVGKAWAQLAYGAGRYYVDAAGTAEEILPLLAEMAEAIRQAAGTGGDSCGASA